MQDSKCESRTCVCGGYLNKKKRGVGVVRACVEQEVEEDNRKCIRHDAGSAFTKERTR
jgi:hypothetical protein